MLFISRLTDLSLEGDVQADFGYGKASVGNIGFIQSAFDDDDRSLNLRIGNRLTHRDRIQLRSQDIDQKLFGYLRHGNPAALRAWARRCAIKAFISASMAAS